MLLSFPNGEHPDRALVGDALLGSDPSDDIVLRGHGLLPGHARFLVGKGGVWLEIAGGTRPAYVNARPVRERALLRAGDVVCIDPVQIVLREEQVGDDRQAIPASAPEIEIPETVEPATDIVLRGVAGPHFGRSFVVGRSLLLGRGAAAQLKLEGPDIADRHAQVERHGNRLALRAISGSRTEVNGIAGTDRRISPGDQIVIGQHRFLVEAPGLVATPGDRDPATLPSGEEASFRDLQPPSTPDDAPPSRGGAVWWLIAAAAVVAAVITGLLLYGPRIGA